MYLSGKSVYLYYRLNNRADVHMSGSLSIALTNFGAAVDFVAANLGVDEQTIQAFDTAVGAASNLASNVSPAEAIAAAAVATAAVVIVGPEALAAGVASVIGEEAMVSAAAALDYATGAAFPGVAASAASLGETIAARPRATGPGWTT